MRFHNLMKATCLLAFAALSSVSPGVAAPANQECTCGVETRWNFPSEASRLLEEIRATSHRLTESTDRLRSFAYSGISWQSHAIELTQVREHVNQIGARIERLQSIRQVIEPWQQEALDSVTRAGVTVATGTESAIRHLNENQNFLGSGTYRNHVASVSSGADQMKQSVTAHLELAETQAKVEALRQQVADLGS
ncbi:MAG TPA: hypothetical protein VKT49_26130 [Bryobacteraceae bacterium]|nr:hypothetical protein [Bryobacteraceae bacterium]